MKTILFLSLLVAVPATAQEYQRGYKRGATMENGGIDPLAPLDPIPRLGDKPGDAYDRGVVKGAGVRYAPPPPPVILQAPINHGAAGVSRGFQNSLSGMNYGQVMMLDQMRSRPYETRDIDAEIEALLSQVRAQETERCINAMVEYMRANKKFDLEDLANHIRERSE